jgi:hypothetical protein
MGHTLAKVMGRCVWLVSAAATCTAAPITYSFSGTGSGTLGGGSFTNKPYVIALIGDTNAIDTTYTGLGEFRNAVTGTIQINGRRKATITMPIVVTTACGGGGGYVGIEKAPGTPPFPSYIYNAQGAPVTDCFLGPGAPTSGLPATASGFSDIPTTRGPVTLTFSSPVTYRALSCTRPRACRKQGAKALRSLLEDVSIK